MIERIDAVKKSLHDQFRAKMEHKERAKRTSKGPNETYKLEVEWCYLMREVEYSPLSQITIPINNVRTFVNSIE